MNLILKSINLKRYGLTYIPYNCSASDTPDVANMKSEANKPLNRRNKYHEFTVKMFFTIDDLQLWAEKLMKF